MIEFNIKRILVAVDFGTASINALNTAIGMARRHHASILLLNVVDCQLLPDLSNEGATSENVLAEIQNSEQQLQSLQHSIIERFLLPCEAISASGTIPESIIKTSIDYQADLIVMGTNGGYGIKEFFIGSNVYVVAKDSVCPVLTIPPEKKWESFQKILFPMRAIPSALEKYDFLRKIIRKNKATLKILGLARDYETDVDFLRDMAIQLNKKLKEDEINASTYFKVGKNMADEVLKIASLMSADLIVITATSESSGKLFFSGPYTRYIISHAHCPVLSIKPFKLNEQCGQNQEHTNEYFKKEMPIYN